MNDHVPPSAPAAKPPFAVAYAREVAFVWRSLRRLGVHERNVEDACQEVFLVAFRKYESFGGGSLRAWLFAILAHVASDYRKRAHVRREVIDEVPEQISPETATDTLEMRRARVHLDEILESLDDEKRAVFILFELEEMPMVEVAATLQCPLQTAYSRLHAARERVNRAVARLSQAHGKEES